jgi:hypothetical protein
MAHQHREDGDSSGPHVGIASVARESRAEHLGAHVESLSQSILYRTVQGRSQMYAALHPALTEDSRLDVEIVHMTCT